MNLFRCVIFLFINSEQMRIERVLAPTIVLKINEKRCNNNNELQGNIYINQ